MTTFAVTRMQEIVPLSPENSDSCRYSATGKQYFGD